MSERIEWACKVVLAKLGEGPAGWRRIAGEVYGCAIRDGISMAGSSFDAASTLALDAIEDLAERGLIYAQGAQRRRCREYCDEQGLTSATCDEDKP